MWILLWFLLSLIVMGVFFWSTAILQQQKKGWSAAAKTLGLTYNDGGRFMASPSMSGTIAKFSISVMTDQLPTNDAQGQRSVTAIEIEMGPGMEVTGLVATPSFAPLIATGTLPQTLTAEEAGLPAGTILKAEDAAALLKTLTPAKIKVLQTLFGTKNAQFLLFLNSEHCILRIETSDPLTDAEKLVKLLRRLVAAAGTLKPPVVQAATSAPI